MTLTTGKFKRIGKIAFFLGARNKRKFDSVFNDPIWTKMQLFCYSIITWLFCLWKSIKMHVFCLRLQAPPWASEIQERVYSLGFGLDWDVVFKFIWLVSYEVVPSSVDQLTDCDAGISVTGVSIAVVLLSTISFCFSQDSERYWEVSFYNCKT